MHIVDTQRPGHVVLNSKYIHRRSKTERRSVHSYLRYLSVVGYSLMKVNKQVPSGIVSVLDKKSFNHEKSFS